MAEPDRLQYLGEPLFTFNANNKNNNPVENMKISQIIPSLALLLAIVSGHSKAQTVSDVNFSDTLPADTQYPNLNLNGAALRELYLLIDTYVGALYLEQPSQSAQEIIQSQQHKRMIFHVLLKKVSARRLSNALYEALVLNISQQQHQVIQADIDTMLSFFKGNLTSGEEASFHYIPNQGTRVTVAGKEKGVIPGKAFFDAMLKVWIGKSPVTRKFKNQILGIAGV